MSKRQANCPSCGGEIAFRPGTRVTICGFCDSIVARTDRALSVQGRVSALVDTQSPLEVGATGRYRGRGFTIVGRTQLSHPGGGVWDEWYLADDSGAWLWLAEAQGQFYVTSRVEEGLTVSPASIKPGQRLAIPGGQQLLVHEVGDALAQTAQGELPFDFQPNQTYHYADLSGAEGEFGTLDFSEDPPLLFLGRQVTLAELNVSPREGFATGRRIETVAVACPRCGARLELHTPDQTQRVGCPSCSSQLEADHGVLQYLKPGRPLQWALELELGSIGTFGEVQYTLVGAMDRSCTVEGTEYGWGEFLLYEPSVGYRWLVVSDGHWNFVSPINAAEVALSGRHAAYLGETFSQFQESIAEVKAVKGEFYWRVEAGQRSATADYVAPPALISLDIAEFSDPKTGTRASEISWSHGTYLSPEEVQRAFGLPEVPSRPEGIAPNMPNPFVPLYQEFMKLAQVLVIVLMAAVVASLLTSPRDVVLTYQAAPPYAGPNQGRTSLVTDPFEIRDGRHALELKLLSSSDTNWLLVEGALVEEGGPESRVFNIAARSSLDKSDSTRRILDAVDPGTYRLRLEAIFDPSKLSPAFQLQLSTGYVRYIYALLALLAIGAGPLYAAMRKGAFEGSRWQNSM